MALLGGADDPEGPPSASASRGPLGSLWPLAWGQGTEAVGAVQDHRGLRSGDSVPSLPRRVASGWADSRGARLRVTRGRSTKSGADGGDTARGWGSPRAGRQDEVPGVPLFRVIEPEGGTGIRPPAGVGVAATGGRRGSSSPRPTLAGLKPSRYFRGLNFTPGENSQECFGR